MNNDKIRDRGNKKWQGFFMPEHISLLRQIQVENQKIQMPLLDDHQLQEYEEKINYAKKYNCPIEFVVFDNGFIETLIGLIHSFDQLSSQIKITMDDGEFEYINFGEIMDIKLNC
ncbi:YolD-like family protein [Heyndrickxia oleronia]|uniref:YolD-like family protein n=1 Tax=Heyndrickxia oleronia TaxID=38875 RepID=A0AAW6SYM5_9BACI|nr:YolD-like family protein [Heyndrickxia oleronia]MCM3240734.1 YolD-like family protein [Heyndrickxia oleronia]MDH5163318.1 YolD-like family protein [Heyndrickxia oleronia]NYV66501.1 YolD-like family protein [Bacillus sp. Gen3]GIN41536.1 hypothetical protein J19TS1_44850 [Heyndrickxia oleronia]